MLYAGVDWTNVLVALIAGLPAIIGALTALRIHRQIQTPSKTNIGRQVEDAHHTSIANNYRLQSLNAELGVQMPAQAAEQEAQVEALNSTVNVPSRVTDIPGAEGGGHGRA